MGAKWDTWSNKPLRGIVAKLLLFQRFRFIYFALRDAGAIIFIQNCACYLIFALIAWAVYYVTRGTLKIRANIEHDLKADTF